MNQSDKILIAGPWVGEFGWELFAWQGYVRALSRKFDQTVIICRDLSRPLYKDFCNNFISINPQGGLADSFFMHGVNFNELLRQVLMEKENSLMSKNPTIFIPRRIGFPPLTHYSEIIKLGEYKIVPEYFQYGNKGEKKYDYIFHVRQRQLRPQHNWEISKWKKLLKYFSIQKKNVACVGTKSQAEHLPGTVDLRDKDLTEVFNAMTNAHCTFGPSSGPMHLASLCGCPHVVWSESDNKIRYEKNWNPLKTKILLLSEFGFQPTADYVFEKFNNWQQTSYNTINKEN